MSAVDPRIIQNVKIEDDVTTFEKICTFCGKRHVLSMSTERFKLWAIQGEKVQIVFPFMSTDEREILISGTCPECWDKMFPEEEV